MMKKISNYIFYLLFFVGYVNIGFTQGRLILNNNGYVVINNSATVVLDNPANNAITVLGTGGNIVSEGENNAIKWNLNTTTGAAYSIPFTTNSGVKIPLVFDKTTAGVGAAANITFSTYETSTDNNTPYPSSVTNMYSSTQGGDGSLFVVDRFWRLDASSYTTKPTLNVVFDYDDNANEMGGTNTITEANLQAQRFNTNTGGWDGILYGTVNTAANTVTVNAIPPADLYEFWTMVDNSSPLPIELLHFNVACNNSKATLNWATATEINNDFFTIQRSIDGADFYPVGEIPGNGNTNSVQNYSWQDEKPLPGVSYYRLKQTDYNGSYEYFNATAFENCDDEGSQVSIFTPNNQSILINVVSQIDEDAALILTDYRGRKVMSKKLIIKDGSNAFTIDVNEVAGGIYFVTLSGNSLLHTQKVFLK